jgi:hypothetical protein
MTITYAPLPLCRPTLRREARAGRGAAREGAITRRQDERRDRRRGGGRWSRYRLMNGAWIGALVGVALALIAAAPAAAAPNRVDPFAHAAAREPKDRDCDRFPRVRSAEIPNLMLAPSATAGAAPPGALASAASTTRRAGLIAAP